MSEGILNLLAENKEWLFGGVGVFALGAIGTFIAWIFKRRKAREAERRSLQRDAARTVQKLTSEANQVSAIGSDLKIAYQTLFAFSAGTNSGASIYYPKKVDEKLATIQQIIDKIDGANSNALSSDEISDVIARHDGNIAETLSIKEQLLRELDDIRGQVAERRQKRL